jgi:hypothetical protein
LFDFERNAALVRDERARVRANRATGLSLAGEHAMAEVLFAQAQKLFDEGPPDADTLAQRAAVRRNRAMNLESMDEHAQAQVLLDEADALVGPQAGLPAGPPAQPSAGAGG